MPTILLTEDDDDMTTPTKPSASNKLYTHTHVEDYIEIIAGYRTPAGKSNYSIFMLPESPVSLARYDVKITESFAEQSNNNIGFTDRQAKLAVDLVIKYERQLFKLGVDIAPVKNNPVFRIPLREIDRTSRAWVENEQIKIRFPYQQQLIELIRTEGKQGKGSIKFNRDNKLWEADLTEHNVNWVYSFSKVNQFQIDSTLQELMDQILAVERNTYKIELRADTDLLSVTNAETSLTDYIENKLGGFSTDNLLTLVDNAPILGYSIDPIIEEVVISAYGTRFWSLCANKELKVDTVTSRSLVPEIINYAKSTNRFPIFIYEPDLSEKLLTEFNKFFAGSVLRLDTKATTVDIPDDIKVVHTAKIPKAPIDRIPLMISSAGMLFGGDRQMWLQTAEKVVYFTKDVYNKTTKDRPVAQI